MTRFSRTPNLPYTVSKGTFVPVFDWLPHEGAPLFHREARPHLIIQQLMEEIASGNYPTSDRYRQLYRQAALVSLFFFTKLIMGYDGPYDEPNYTLHLDMCNFIQEMEVPGRKAGLFMFRSGLKTTIGTKGRMAWKLVRQPNLRLGIGSSIVDRAQEFRDAVKQVYERNELFQWLFPEKVPVVGQARWTQKDFVVPDRTLNLPEPSIKVFAIGGSTAGIHVDDLTLDDIVDDSQLDSNRLSSADMQRTSNWLQANIPSLVVSWLESTVFMMGTRYSQDDPYEWVLEDLAAKYGYWEGMDYGERPDGEWHVYYRQALEYEDVAYPARLTKKGLAKMLETNPWTYWFQYINNVQRGGSTEFADYPVGNAWLDWRDEIEEWVMILQGKGGRTDKEWPLSLCDLVQAVDPAGSEVRTSSRTSRSAHGILATTPEGDHVLIGGHCDYVAPTTTMFDWMFDAVDKFPQMRVSAMEVQGPFKVLKTAIQAEQRVRQKWLSVVPVTAPGNKDARIRTAVQPVLHQGALYCVEGVRGYLVQELKGFPNSHKKDFLDMLAIALKAAVVPPTAEQLAEDEDYEEMMSVGGGVDGRNHYTGY